MQVANNLMDSFAAKAEPKKGPVLVVTAFDQKESHLLIEHLRRCTSDAHTKLCIGWKDLEEKFNHSKSFKTLASLAEGLSEHFEGRHVVFLLDEIRDMDEVEFLADIPISELVSCIFILNQTTSRGSIILPPSFHRVTPTVPCRSTRSIIALAHFMAKCYHLKVPDGEFGSNIEGFKPIPFDVGKDDEKMKQTLSKCDQLLGEKAVDKVAENRVAQMKQGPWLWEFNCNVESYYGCEADDMIVVITGNNHGERLKVEGNFDTSRIMDMITRARQRLAVILVDSLSKEGRQRRETWDFFHEAAEQGLIEFVNFSQIVSSGSDDSGKS